MIIVMNKWDLALEAAAKKAAESKRHEEKSTGANPNKLLADYELIVRAKLKFLSYAPIVFLSALTGDRVEKLYSMLDRVAAARRPGPAPDRPRPEQILWRRFRSRPL